MAVADQVHGEIKKQLVLVRLLPARVVLAQLIGSSITMYCTYSTRLFDA